MSKSKILVTGAAGTIGSHVFLELMSRENNYSVRLFEKAFPEQKHFKKKLKRFLKCIESFSEETEIVWGDLTVPEDVEQAVKGVDSVIHLAAIIPPLADEDPSLARQVNVEGTRNLVEAMKRNGAKRLVYTSSVAVYGDRLDNPWIKRTDPLKPSEGDNYAHTKIEAEKIIRESFLDWTIFRLGAIFITRLDTTPKALEMAMRMPLETKVEWLSSKDCAYALVEALSHDELIGQIHNLGGGRECRSTFREYLCNALAIFGLSDDVLPRDTFATKGFHCGFFDDQESEELQRILWHQRSSIEDSYEEMKSNINPIKRSLIRFSTHLFKPIVRRYFERKSKAFQRKIGV